MMRALVINERALRRVFLGRNVNLTVRIAILAALHADEDGMLALGDWEALRETVGGKAKNAGLFSREEINRAIATLTGSGVLAPGSTAEKLILNRQEHL